MSKKFLPFVFLFVISNLTAQQRPKLVIGIVVDQMKMDYLYRFQNDFSDNGFKRLMNNGFTFYNMQYNYMPTYTAPGHASIYTGTTPAMHGIVSNEWFSRKLGKDVYCTDDFSVATLGGGTKEEGQMSPKNLQTTTITDELRFGRCCAVRFEITNKNTKGRNFFMSCYCESQKYRFEMNS